MRWLKAPTWTLGHQSSSSSFTLGSELEIAENAIVFEVHLRALLQRFVIQTDVVVKAATVIATCVC